MATAWFSPSMYNIVKQNGRDVHLVIMPDHDCVVNSGLGSTRGAKIAELSYSTVTGTQPERLTEPLVWRYGTLTPTSWDDAVDLVAEVTRRVVETQGEDGLIVSAYDHGGAGGGYENTWATGKLYFESMKIKNIRIHNRPAYNSEVHGTRDMGVGELNNCYEDAELADTIMAVGTQFAGDADQLLPEPLGAEPARHQRRQEEGGVRQRADRPGQDHLRRSAPHADHRRLRGGGRRGQRAAPRDQPRHRPGAVQRAVHRDRRQGLGRSRVHRGQHQRLRRRGQGEPHHDRAGRADHRPEARRYPQGGRMDRPAEARRRAAADDVRLREGPDLGQRQLPHQPGAGEHRAGDRQRRPPGRRLRADGRAPGRLRAAGLSRRAAGAVHRPVADRRQRRRPPHLGLRPLQDHAERDRVQARLQAAHRPGEDRDGLGARRRPRRPDRGHHGRDRPGRPVRRGRRHRADARSAPARTSCCRPPHPARPT